MLRNDYRRALIMLRPLKRGMSGHVRLERRTLAATMRFTVQGSTGGVLHALLMAYVSGHWVKYKLGALKNDARGQSGMTASFDPRNLRGLDLDKYTLLALVETGDGEPELVMTGMVNGYKDVNWAQAVPAATSEFANRDDSRGVAAQIAEAREEASDESTETIAETAEAECCCDENTESETVSEEAERPVTVIEVVSAAEDSQNDGEEREAREESERPDLVVEIEAAADMTPTVTDIDDVRTDSEEDARDDREEKPDYAEDESRLRRATACELLGLSPGISWPEDIEAVRDLFERAQASDSFKLDDFVFVDAPLPGEDGTNGLCAIGLKARDGKPVSVCYALPGNYSIDPPPGLEDYRYLGGWWYTVLELV